MVQGKTSNNSNWSFSNSVNQNGLQDEFDPYCPGYPKLHQCVRSSNLCHHFKPDMTRSRPENTSRAYTIGTTFPNRILEDNMETIEAAGLINSVVVQRWA